MDYYLLLIKFIKNFYRSILNKEPVQTIGDWFLILVMTLLMTVFLTISSQVWTLNIHYPAIKIPLMIASPFVTLLTLPLFLLVPPINHMVDWLFVGFVIKNSHAWIILISYYVVLSYVICRYLVYKTVVSLLKRKSWRH